MALAQLLLPAGDQEAPLAGLGSAARIQLGNHEQRILQGMAEDEETRHPGAEADGVVTPFAGHDALCVEVQEACELSPCEMLSGGFPPEVRKREDPGH